MIHIDPRTLVALSLGLLLAGCSAGHAADERSASQSSLPARTTGQAAARSIDRPVSAGGVGSSRPDQLFGYSIAPEARHDITLGEIREHVRDNTAVFIDARGTAEFARGHVRGAFNMPAGHKEAYIEPIVQSVAPDQLIIIYCYGPHCDSGDMVYEYLASQGFTNMRVFKPGWETLRAASDLQ
jgi:rhodanese-related sulfurtransferase